MATVTEKFARPQVRQTQCFIGGEWVPAADEALGLTNLRTGELFSHRGHCR